MTWRIKSFTFMPTFSFLFLFCMLFSFLFINNVSAVSDLTVTYNQGDTISNWDDVFPNCDSTCLADYSYLIVEQPIVSDLNPSLRLQFVVNNNSYSINPSFSRLPFVIFNTPFVPNYVNYVKFSNSPVSTFSSSVTFTLTESYSSCPPIEPCPEIPESPYHNDLIDIKHSIYVCAGVLLVLYFFYCIYRMIIKTTGGQ